MTLKIFIILWKIPPANPSCTKSCVLKTSNSKERNYGASSCLLQVRLLTAILNAEPLAGSNGGMIYVELPQSLLRL